MIALAIAIIIALLGPAILGSVVLLLIARPKDGWTNRISHLQLVWMALAYPSADEFKHLDWLRKDENEKR